MKAEALKWIIDGYEGPAEKLSELLSRELARIDDIRAQLRAQAACLDRWKVQYENHVSEVNKQIEIIQSECPHWSSTHYSDPSGGSDSHTTCDICWATF